MKTEELLVKNSSAPLFSSVADKHDHYYLQIWAQCVISTKTQEETHEITELFRSWEISEEQETYAKVSFLFPSDSIVV